MIFLLHKECAGDRLRHTVADDLQLIAYILFILALIILRIKKNFFVYVYIFRISGHNTTIPMGWHANRSNGIIGFPLQFIQKVPKRKKNFEYLSSP